MQIKINNAPEGAKFESDFPYLVYGSNSQLNYVFDDNGDSYFLYELTFVKVTD